MKYDDASWHSGGDFPPDLPPEAGATHIGMFVAWALLNGLAGELHVEDFADDLEKLRKRRITPGRYLLRVCDGKFTDEDLNREGNAFAAAYFDLKKGKYIADYNATVVGDLESEYHVPDTWEVFDKLEPVMSRRFKSWRKRRAKKR